MKYFVGVVFGLVSLIGCGSEDSGSLQTETEAVDSWEGAASAVIFSTKVVVNNTNTNCRVVTGTVDRGGGWRATSPVANIACEMPKIFAGQPWDTTRLRQITYNHPDSVALPITCAIIWRRRSDNFVVAQTPPLDSYLNSPSHFVVGAEYFSNGDGWVRSASPLSFSWELSCRLPFGARFYGYTFSYEDTI